MFGSSGGFIFPRLIKRSFPPLKILASCSQVLRNKKHKPALSLFQLRLWAFLPRNFLHSRLYCQPFHPSSPSSLPGFKVCSGEIPPCFQPLCHPSSPVPDRGESVRHRTLDLDTRVPMSPRPSRLHPLVATLNPGLAFPGKDATSFIVAHPPGWGDFC